MNSNTSENSVNNTTTLSTNSNTNKNTPVSPDIIASRILQLNSLNKEYEYSPSGSLKNFNEQKLERRKRLFETMCTTRGIIKNKGGNTKDDKNNEKNDNESNGLITDISKLRVTDITKKRMTISGGLESISDFLISPSTDDMRYAIYVIFKHIKDNISNIGNSINTDRENIIEIGFIEKMHSAHIFERLITVLHQVSLEPISSNIDILYEIYFIFDSILGVFLFIDDSTETTHERLGLVNSINELFGQGKEKDICVILQNLYMICGEGLDDEKNKENMIKLQGVICAFLSKIFNIIPYIREYVFNLNDKQLYDFLVDKIVKFVSIYEEEDEEEKIFNLPLSLYFHIESTLSYVQLLIFLIPSDIQLSTEKFDLLLALFDSLLNLELYDCDLTHLVICGIKNIAKYITKTRNHEYDMMFRAFIMGGSIVNFMYSIKLEENKTTEDSNIKNNNDNNNSVNAAFIKNYISKLFISFSDCLDIIRSFFLIEKNILTYYREKGVEFKEKSDIFFNEEQKSLYDFLKQTNLFSCYLYCFKFIENAISYRDNFCNEFNNSSTKKDTQNKNCLDIYSSTSLLYLYIISFNTFREILGNEALSEDIKLLLLDSDFILLLKRIAFERHLIVEQILKLYIEGASLGEKERNILRKRLPPEEIKIFLMKKNSPGIEDRDKKMEYIMNINNAFNISNYSN